MKRHFLICIIGMAFSAGAVLADPGTDFFESKVRPILVDHCYRCHSAEAEEDGKLKAGFRLDSRESIRRGGDSGPGVVPGKPDEGTLIASIRYDGDTQMPPKGKLPKEVIADLEKWVAMGAPDPRDDKPASQPAGIDLEKAKSFWAFQNPVAVEPPELPELGQKANLIDRFIRAKLKQEKLPHAEQADKRTLIRRLYFDMIGLPPTPEQVQAFVDDQSDTAYAKIVEELLNSPHYGERWARHWLDVARFAEDQAHTFQVRQKTSAYQYRDWVIQALNSDMPYDRFVVLQIAGDLLPESDGDRFTRFAGLGFNGLGAEYYKNTAKEQAIADELDDRIDTLTRGFLGMTVACARCHDHKFDPIPTKDYYAIAGVYNGFSPNDYPLVSDDVVKTYDEAQAKLKAAEKEHERFLAKQAFELQKEAVTKVADYAVLAWRVQALRQRGQKPNVDKLAQEQGLIPYFLNRWVNAFQPNSSAGLASEWRKVQSVKVPKEFKAESEIPKQVRELAEQAAAAWKDRFTEYLAKVEKAVEKGEYKLAPNARVPGLDNKLFDQLKPLFAQGNAPFFVQPKPLEENLLTGQAKNTAERLNRKIEKAKAEAPAMYPIAHGIKGGGNEMKVFIRGNPKNLGEPAPKGFLSVIQSEADDCADGEKEYGRLELARAIAASDNPLTARVIVNRVWHWHFGRGLVNTPSNFGELGDRPSHPELLDWLAVNFMDNGWSLKWLHRQILLSQTYQQANQIANDEENADPENIYLGRFQRRRLEAEVWRDTILSVAGKLDSSIGGPTFDLANPDVTRRTVYAKISRHQINSFLRLFDFPDANVTADGRTETTVPQQQLFALNSEFMVRNAKALAERVNKAADNDQGRVTTAYQLAYQREPSDEELSLALGFLASEPNQADNSQDKLSRFEQLCQVLLAANELLYLD